MHRIYDFIKEQTICEYDTIIDIIIYINSRCDLPINDCYIQYYDGDLDEWINY